MAGEKMETKLALLGMFAVAVLLLSGCAQQQPLPPAPIVGNDADAHGCIGSAGYTWCAAKQKCLREWEENCTAEAALPEPNKSIDLHGCNASKGLEWCKEKQRCIISADEKCTELSGSGTGDHGCSASAGYAWCEGLSRCILSSSENCTAPAASPYVAIVQENCGKANVSSVSICGEYVKVVSSLDGGGITFYKPGSAPVVCPLVSPGSMGNECKLLMAGNGGTEQKMCE
jgi:hypothetical protein